MFFRSDADDGEGELQRLTDALPVLISYIDSDQIYRFANKRYEEWFPLNRDDLVGKSIREIVGEEAHAKVASYIERALAGETVTFEQLMPYTQAGVRHVHVEYVPRASPEGVVEGFYALVQDMTAAKSVEGALRQSEERFHAIVNSIDQMIWSTRPDGYHDYFNERWYEYTGVPTGSTDGQAWNGVFHPDDQDRTWATWRHSLATGERYHIEYRLRHRSGEYRWVIGRAQPVHDAQGRIVRWYGTCTDIHDLKVAEERMLAFNTALADAVERKTAERNQLWNLSEDMLARADYAGNLTAVSPSWSKVLGYTEAEILARPYAQIIHPEYVDDVVAALDGMRETGQPVRFENKVLDAGGRWVPIQWTVSPEADGVHFIAIGRDITAERQAAAELERAQAALRQSQKMDAMGQLTGGVAHDFNNLLTPIVATLDFLIRKGIGSEREQRLIRGAAESADRSRTLVQRLLAFARRQPLQSVAIDIGRLIEGMSDLIASTTGPQIRVVTEIEESLPSAKADPNQLEMALLNLGVNARDAMPDGGTLRITAKKRAVGRDHPTRLPDGEYICLSVADTGAGMDGETLARATEPFFSTKGVGKGTGLGLSMVHGLAAQLGGALTMSSQKGVGTNVELWLPITDAPSEREGEPATPTVPAAEEREVLLVDDEALVRMSSAAMLSDLGYTVIEADCAEAAMRLVEQGLEPELLVTDHLMPGLSGTELARLLLQRLPQLKVLIISGYAESAGLDPDLGRLTKPFKEAELAASLAALDEPQGH